MDNIAWELHWSETSHASSIKVNQSQNQSHIGRVHCTIVVQVAWLLHISACGGRTLKVVWDEQMENFFLLSAQLITYWTWSPKNSLWCRWIWGHICLLLIWERRRVFPRLKKIPCFSDEERKARNNNPKKGRSITKR